jgi:serine/threonine protein kinase
LKPPENFVSEQHNRLRIIRRDTISLSEVLSIIQMHGERNGNWGGHSIKEGPKSTVYLLLVSLEGKKKNLCVKHYKFQGWFNSLKNIFTPSRALSSLEAAENLYLLGIKTARPLAVVIRGKRFIPKESVLIMEDISQYDGLPEYIEKNFSPPLSKDSIRQKRIFIRQFAHFLSQLHDKGVCQNDFKTTNVFVDEDSTEKKNFLLIDLDQVLFLERVSKRRKIKNLVQINTSIPWEITLADRMRFFHHYTGKKRLEKEDKQMIQSIIRLSWKRNPRCHPRFKMDAGKIREGQ